MAMEMDRFLAQILANSMTSKAADRRQQGRQDFEVAEADRQRELMLADQALRPVIGHIGDDGFALGAGDGTQLHSGYGASRGDDQILASLLASSNRGASASNAAAKNARTIDYQAPGTQWDSERREFVADPYDQGTLANWQHDVMMDTGGQEQILSTAEQIKSAAHSMGVNMGDQEAVQQAFEQSTSRSILDEFYPDLGEIRFDEGATRGKNYVDDRDRLWWLDRHMNRGEAMKHYSEKYGIDPGLAAYYLDQISPKGRQAIEDALR